MHVDEWCIFRDALKQALPCRMAVLKNKECSRADPSICQGNGILELKFIMNENSLNKALTCVMEWEKPTDEAVFIWM